MADQPTYLDESGNPVQSTYLDDNGNPVAATPPAQLAVSHVPNVPLAVSHQTESPGEQFFRHLFMGYQPSEFSSQLGFTPKDIQGPGFLKIPGVDEAGQYLQNKLQNTGNWWAGAGGSLLRDVADLLSTGFDPRTVGLKKGPAIPAKPEPKLLGPAPFQAGPIGEGGAVTQGNLTGLPYSDIPPAQAAHVAGQGIRPIPKNPAELKLGMNIPEGDVYRSKEGEFYIPSDKGTTYTGKPITYDPVTGKPTEPLLPSAQKQQIIPTKNIKAEVHPVLVSPEAAPRGVKQFKVISSDGVAVNSQIIDLPMDATPAQVQALKIGAEQGPNKLGNLVSNIWNAPRSMGAGGDLSYALRQGKAYIFHSEYWKSMKPLIDSLGSNDAFEASQEALRNRKYYDQAVRDGLAFSDLGSARDEFLKSSLPERIPLLGKYYQVTNRANTAFLNNLRYEAYESMMDSAKALGQDLSQVGNTFAEHVNTMTGRGSLNFKIGDKVIIPGEKGEWFLNGVGYAPRFMASRLHIFTKAANVANPYWWMTVNPVIRQETLRNLFAIATTATVTHSLAKMFGGSISTDPTNADFMKDKFGNARLDPNVGLQQYVVLAARLWNGTQTSSTSGKEWQLGATFGGPNRTSDVEDFLLNKSNPWIRFAGQTGRALIGNMSHPSQIQWKLYGKPYNPGSEFMRMFIPMTVGDMYDVWQENPKLLPVFGPLSVLGESQQTYQ